MLVSGRPIEESMLAPQYSDICMYYDLRSLSQMLHGKKMSVFGFTLAKSDGMTETAAQARVQASGIKTSPVLSSHTPPGCQAWVHIVVTAHTTVHHPVAAAKQVAAISEISGGRISFQIVAG